MRVLHVVLLLLFCTTASWAQQVEKEPLDAWHSRMWKNDSTLEDCMLNVELFPHGFFWVDIHGHTWLILETPVWRLVEDNSPGKAITLIAYTYYNAQEIAMAQGWPIYRSLDEYPWMNPPKSEYPPVFVQENRRVKQAESVHEKAAYKPQSPCLY